uniref:Uncharacterized protein n=1 Tax=Salmonella phage vB_SEnST11_KE23 TaxID=3161174 RepID=A0AAU8GG53_9CAUD
MANWKQTFRIDDIWKKRNGECGPEDWTDKTVHELAKEIARRIQRKFPQRMLDGDDCDFNLVEIYDWFMAVPTPGEYKFMLTQILQDENASDDEYMEWSKRTPLVEFNEGMSLLYDWCDRNLVWVQK